MNYRCLNDKSMGLSISALLAATFAELGE